MVVHKVKLNEAGVEEIKAKLALARDRGGRWVEHLGWDIGAVVSEVETKIEDCLDRGESVTVEIDGLRNAQGYVIDFAPHSEALYEVAEESIED